MYKRLLTVDSSLDLMLAISALLVQPIYFTGDGYLVGFSHGPFAHQSEAFDATMMLIFTVVFLLNILCISVQFVYRTQRLTFAVLSALLVWTSIGIAVIYGLYHPPSGFHGPAFTIVRKNDWPIDPEFPLVGAYLVNRHPANLLGCVLDYDNYSELHRGSRLRKEDLQLHPLNWRIAPPAAQQLHKDFNRTLFAMAICPLFTTGAPVVFFLISMSFALNPGVVTAFISVAFSSIALLNPLTTIFFMRCYRRPVVSAIKWLFVGKTVVTEQANIATTFVSRLEVPDASQDVQS